MRTHVHSSFLLRLIHEQIKQRFLMSLDGANSMPLPALSMPLPGNGDMSMPVSSADFSMPLPADMSMPTDADFSFPMGADMSMPLPADEMMSLDLALSMTMPDDAHEDPCDKDSNPSFTLVEAFEVTPPNGESPDTMLLEVLTAEVPKDFEVCSTVARQLWETERKLAEYVLGVEIDSIVVDDGENCASGADACEVVNAKFDVIHKDGTSSESATDEFLGKLAARLASVDGVKLVNKSSQPDSSTTQNTDTETTEGDGKLGGVKTAAAVVCSVAVVAVALVLVQRKMAKKRSDDMSVDESASTSQNSAAFDSSLSIF